MRGWPEEVIAWLRENVPGRTTKQVTELINQQGFDKKYGMVFSDAAIKGAKNRYGIKSGTTGGVPKGYSLKYPEGMESYIRSIATGRKTKEIAELVSAHFGIEFSEKQCKAYKKNHDIISGVDCRFEKGHVPANKGKPMSQSRFGTKRTDLSHVSRYVLPEVCWRRTKWCLIQIIALGRLDLLRVMAWAKIPAEQ